MDDETVKSINDFFNRIDRYYSLDGLLPIGKSAVLSAKPTAIRSLKQLAGSVVISATPEAAFAYKDKAVSDLKTFYDDQIKTAYETISAKEQRLKDLNEAVINAGIDPYANDTLLRIENQLQQVIHSRPTYGSPVASDVSDSDSDSVNNTAYFDPDEDDVDSIESDDEDLNDPANVIAKIHESAKRENLSIQQEIEVQQLAKIISDLPFNLKKAANDPNVPLYREFVVNHNDKEYVFDIKYDGEIRFADSKIGDINAHGYRGNYVGLYKKLVDHIEFHTEALKKGFTKPVARTSKFKQRSKPANKTSKPIIVRIPNTFLDDFDDVTDATVVTIPVEPDPDNYF